MCIPAAHDGQSPRGSPPERRLYRRGAWRWRRKPYPPTGIALPSPAADSASPEETLRQAVRETTDLLPGS